MDEEYNKRRPIPRPPSDSSRGMLRSKIECGMGTVPLSTKVHLQTWDGVMSGDRLLTMACSDKILRWNIVGKITFLSFSTDLKATFFHGNGLLTTLSYFLWGKNCQVLSAQN